MSSRGRWTGGQRQLLLMISTRIPRSRHCCILTNNFVALAGAVDIFAAISDATIHQFCGSAIPVNPSLSPPGCTPSRALKRRSSAVRRLPYPYKLIVAMKYEGAGNWGHWQSRVKRYLLLRSTRGLLIDGIADAPASGVTVIRARKERVNALLFAETEKRAEKDCGESCAKV